MEGVGHGDRKWGASQRLRHWLEVCKDWIRGLPFKQR